MEIIEEHPELELLLVPVSSGGLAAGVAPAVKHLRPNVRVVGVQPERANTAYVSMRQGTPTTIDYWESIADGLSAVRPGHLPFLHMQEYLDDIVLVSDVEIAHAFQTLFFRCKMVAEPAGRSRLRPISQAKCPLTETPLHWSAEEMSHRKPWITCSLSQKQQNGWLALTR
jgi:threonine dehydratase